MLNPKDKMGFLHNPMSPKGIVTLHLGLGLQDNYFANRNATPTLMVSTDEVGKLNIHLYYCKTT